MKGFRAGLRQGLRADKKKKPLSKKERAKLKRLQDRQRAMEEAIY